MRMGVLALGGMLLTGCASISGKDVQREFVAEKQWVRSTYSDDMYVGPKMSHLMKPLLVDEYLFQSNGTDGILAFNSRTGRQVWRFDIENGSPGAVYNRGRLYFGGGNGHVYAVKAFNGEVVWDYSIGVEVLSAPTFHKNTVFVLTGNNVVHAIDAATGKKKWLYNRKDTTTISVNGATQPVVYGNNLIVGFSDGFLASLRISDGTLIWERQLNLAPRFSDIDSTPVIDGKNIFVSGYDGELYALRAKDGQIEWQLRKGGYAPVTIHKNTLFYSTSRGEVLALNKSNGKTKWVYKLKDGIASQVNVHKNVAYFAQSHGPLMGLSVSNGAPVFSYDPGRGALAAPTFQKETGRLFLMSKEGNIHALDVGWKDVSRKWPWEK